MRRPTAFLLVSLTCSACALSLLVPAVGSPQEDHRSLSKRDVARVLVGLEGEWLEADDRKETYERWHGQAFVVGEDDRHITLVTDSSRLGLEALCQADGKPHSPLGGFTGGTDDDVEPGIEVAGYRITLRFPSGKTRPAVRIAETTDAVDVALIEVPRGGLVRGRDYVVVPVAKSAFPAPGDAVVLVCDPKRTPDVLNRRRVQRVLRVGARSGRELGRLKASAPASRVRMIEYDPVPTPFPGSFTLAGGPVLIQSEGGYVAVAFQGASGNRATELAAALKSRFVAASADPDGACQLIRKLFQVVARPQ